MILVGKVAYKNQGQWTAMGIWWSPLPPSSVGEGACNLGANGSETKALNTHLQSASCYPESAQRLDELGNINKKLMSTVRLNEDLLYTVIF